MGIKQGLEGLTVFIVRVYVTEHKKVGSITGYCYFYLLWMVGLPYFIGTLTSNRSFRGTAESNLTLFYQCSTIAHLKWVGFEALQILAESNMTRHKSDVAFDKSNSVCNYFDFWQMDCP